MPLTIIIIIITIIIIIDIATLSRRCRPEGRGEPAAADGRPRDRGGPRAGRRLGPGGAQVQYSTVQYSGSTVYLVSVAQEREVHPQLLPPRRLDRLHQAGGAEEDVGG